MVLVFTVSTNTAFAASTTEVYDGVSPIDPGQKISLDEIDIPTDVWNIPSKGEYTFSGETNKTTSTLYSNYKFTGQSNYVIGATNDSDYSLTVTLKTATNTYGTMVVKAHSKNLMSVNKVGANKKVYLKFSSSKYLNFEGHIY